MNVTNFDRIWIKNFKSIGEEVTLSYQDLIGMTYILGENIDLPDIRNGVGKSAIFVDALLMCLFGQLSTKKVKNERIFHRGTSDSLGWIKVRMFVNGQEWNVHCILNKSKSGNVSITNTIYKGEVKDDNNKSKSSNRETLKYISEQVLKCDIDTFRNAVVLSSTNIQSFFSLPEPARNAYLDSVFTLAAFGKAFELTKKNVNRLKRDLSSQREIFEDFKKNYEEIVKKSDEFTKKKEAELEQLQLESDNLNDQILELQNFVGDPEPYELEIEQHNADISKYAFEVEALKEKREKLQPTPASDQDELDAFAKEQTNELNKKIEEINLSIKEAEAKQERCQLGLEELEAKREELRAKLSKAKSQEAELSDKVTKIVNKISEIVGEIVAMHNIKKKFEETYDMLCEECRKKTHDHFNFDQERYDKFTEARTKLETAHDSLVKNEIEPNDAEIKSVQKEVDGIDEKNDKIRKAQSLLEQQIKDLEQRKVSGRNDMAEVIAKKREELYEASQAEYKQAIQRNLDQSAEISERISAAKDAIRSLERNLADIEQAKQKVDQSIDAFERLGKRIEEKTKEENPFESLVADAKKKMDTTKDAIKDILVDQRKYELLYNIFDENGVKKHIVANIVASLNVLIKKYLAEMGTDYTIIFDSNFNYSFYTSSGETDYYLFSSGERRRLDIAVMFALRDILFSNGLVTNILIVDEVLDSGIDGYALYAILNILKNKASDNNLGCIVISHRNEIKEDLTDLFDRVLVVKRENGESSISQR